MKRIFCITFISVVFSFSFLTGYCSLYSVPVYGAQDQWEDLTSNEQLVDAFRAYCKSRNTVIDGSLLDAVTSFTTTTFNNLCNTLGIDVTLLQAELQRSYTGSGYKYAFSQLGLSTYNRIFAEFLQNNDLAVGDTVNDKTLYSGEYFDGYLIWIGSFTLPVTNDNMPYVQRGSYYLYSRSYIMNNVDSVVSFPIANKSYNITQCTDYAVSSSIKYLNSISLFPVDGSSKFNYYYFAVTGNYQLNGSLKTIYDGFPIIYKDSSVGQYYLAFYSNRSDTANGYPEHIRNMTKVYPSSDDVQATDVYITTNNLTINNETVINEGDTYIIDSDGQPGDGGSGDDSDDDWNPVLPDVPDAGSDPSGGNTIDWPDLDLPDFDLPNFSLGDLRLKFPFSIPFDIVSILGVINAPAVAPVIQEDIPIRIDLMNVDYTIPINLDMSDSLYDNFAVLVRAVEFIGFCIGLIHLTIRLVKG